MRYKAFISYSHVHRDLADALQVALQRFGTPWYQARGLRIFQDKAGLGATPELWVDLQRALDESEYFVFLASPEGALSEWVRREADYWIKKRSTEQVIVALASGIIIWDSLRNDFDPTLTTALPPAFNNAFSQMPLYVDFRTIKPAEYRLSNDEFRDKVATVASTLHGRSKDDLYGLQVSSLIVADARRMAAEAQLAFNERSLHRCLRLGTAALELTEAHGEPREPTAESAVREALAQMGGRSLGSISAHAYPPVAMSPDGDWLATVGRDEGVYLWDLSAAGDLEAGPYEVPELPRVRFVRFSCDNRWLIAVSNERSEGEPAWGIHLWDVQSRGPRHTALQLPGGEPATRFAVGDDGRYVAATSTAGSTIFIWDLVVNSSEPTRSVAWGSGAIENFEFSVGGSAALVARGTNGVIRVWQLTEHAADPPLTVEAGGSLSSLCLAPDGLLLVTITWGGAPRIWRLHRGGEHKFVDVEALYDLVHWIDISPDGRWALLISGSGPSYLADLRSGDPTREYSMIPTPGGSLRRHAFSPDSNWLATATGPVENFPEFHYDLEPEYTVRLLHLGATRPTRKIGAALRRQLRRGFRANSSLIAGPPMHELEGHDDVVLGLAFSPDGDRLVSNSMDRTTRVWDIKNLARTEPQVLVGDDEIALTCEVSRSGGWLVTTSGAEEEKRSARLWSLTGTSSSAAPVRLSTSAQIDNFEMTPAFALSPDGRLLLTLAKSELWEFDAGWESSLRPISRRPTTWSDPVKRGIFSPKGDWLLLYPGGVGLVMCDLGSRGDAPQLTALDTGGNPVRWAGFSPDGRFLLAMCGPDLAGQPVELRLWNAPTPAGGAGRGRRRRRPSLSRRGQTILISANNVSEMRWTPDGRWFVVFEEETGRLWELGREGSDAEATKLTGHVAPVTDTAMSPSGHELVTAGKDGKVLLWTLERSAGAPDEVLTEIAGAVNSLSVNWESDLVFVGGEDGSARLLKRRLKEPSETVELSGHEGHVAGALSKNGNWLATDDGFGVRIFDLDSFECHLSIPHTGESYILGRPGLWFTRDGRWLIITRREKVFLVSLESGSLAPIELRGHNYERIVTRLSSDEHWLVTADLWMMPPTGFEPVSRCYIWDLWSPNPADSAVALPGLTQGADRLAITNDDQWLITGSPDGVRLWPLGTQHLIGLAKRVLDRELTEEERQRYGAIVRYGSTPEG